MDRSTERQSRIDLRREEIAAPTRQYGRSSSSEWNSPGPDDRAWLMYSANYLFRTQGVRWAMDPLELHSRAAGADMDVARDLKAWISSC